MSTDVNLRSFGPENNGTQPDFSAEAFNGAGYADATIFEGGGPYVYTFPSPKLGLLHPIIVWCFMTLRRWGFFR